MQVLISGQHIFVENSLQEYVRNRVLQITHKYFVNPISANIHFSKEGFQFICDIVFNDRTGRNIVLKGNAVSDDIYSSFDMSLSKLGKQLRKYKSKLKDRHEKVKISELVPKAVKYVITPNKDE